MLFKSGENLEAGAIAFIEDNESITLFSAYLKLEALKRINLKNNIKQIVVRWEIQDLCLGVSDIDLYHYCRDHDIALFRNTRIHLKAFWDNGSSVLFGSANVSNIGLGEKASFNYELNGLNEHMSFSDICYLNQIISKSQYVSEDLYNQLKHKVDSTDMPTLEYENIPTQKAVVDSFLISELPMYDDIRNLFLAYKSPNELEDLDQTYLAHDIAIYKIPPGLNEEAFYSHLKSEFNAHPFIIKFKEAVRSHIDVRGDVTRNGSLSFGTVRIWFQENTTTVPTPRTYELNDFINVLYAWINYFDPCYRHSVEGRHSDIIRYKDVWL